MCIERQVKISSSIIDANMVRELKWKTLIAIVLFSFYIEYYHNLNLNVNKSKQKQGYVSLLITSAGNNIFSIANCR